MIENYLLILLALIVLYYIWFYFSYKRFQKDVRQCCEALTRLNNSLTALLESSKRLDEEFNKALRNIEEYK